jgi:hypothetical protein
MENIIFVDLVPPSIGSANYVSNCLPFTNYWRQIVPPFFKGVVACRIRGSFRSLVGKATKFCCLQWSTSGPAGKPSPPRIQST